MEHGHKYEELLVEPGYKAPDLKLKDENSKEVSLYRFMDEHSTVLVFIKAVDDQHTGQQVDYLKDSYAADQVPSCRRAGSLIWQCRI